MMVDLPCFGVRYVLDTYSYVSRRTWDAGTVPRPINLVTFFFIHNLCVDHSVYGAFFFN